jgi:predicted enzyme related to lactoylglutathione lyase
MKNAINWFEIPVNDMDRGCRFYEGALCLSLRRESFFGIPMAVFPSQDPGVGGALVRDDKRPVAAGGPLVYLDVTGRLDACLDRVPGAGGVVVQPRTSIGDNGFIALVRDSEGNTVWSAHHEVTGAGTEGGCPGACITAAFMTPYGT